MLCGAYPSLGARWEGLGEPSECPGQSGLRLSPRHLPCRGQGLVLRPPGGAPWRASPAPGRIQVPGMVPEATGKVASWAGTSQARAWAGGRYCPTSLATPQP